MAIKLIKVAKEFNVGLHTIVETLHGKGFQVDEKPTTDITDEMLAVLQKEFQKDLVIKQEADKLARPTLKKEPAPLSPPAANTGGTPATPPATRPAMLPPREDGTKTTASPNLPPKTEPAPVSKTPEPELPVRERPALKIVGKIDLDAPKTAPKPPQPAVVEPEMKKPEPTPPVVKPLEEKPATTPTPSPEVPVAEKPSELPSVQKTTPEPPKKEARQDFLKREDPPVPKKQADNRPPKSQESTPVVEKPTPTSTPPTPPPTPPTPPSAEEPKTDELYRADATPLRGLKILGRINLNPPRKPESSSDRNQQGNQQGNNRGGNQQGGQNRDRGGNQNRGGNNQQGGGNRNHPQNQGGGQNRPPNPQGGNQTGGQQQGGTGNNNNNDDAKRKRKRKKVPQQPVTAASLQATMTGNQGDKKGKGRVDAPREVSQKEIEDQIKQTMARLGAGASRKRQKIRRDKRDVMRERAELAEQARSESDKTLQVTEFISVSDLASLLEIKPADIIKSCMALGIFVSINQRLDAEIIELVAGENGYTVQFISAEEQVEVEEEEIDDPKDLRPRQPIVTVMGHVDHGKTSLLDFIRRADVASGEAGGITQHIGAYEVMLDKENEHKKITFLDTPGHEAFTAMRARGAKVTDIAVIVIAADDSIMPQTREAISHAQAAGVPLVFAINKIDKNGADPERIKNELSQMNLLVEEWGGKYQSQDISAKKGLNIDKLLEKVLLEAELLELKANPKRRAVGTVLEASLDKGRGYVTKILVENGTLRKGDPIIAGEFAGKVKAMYNERGKEVKEAGPASPVLVLGLPGAPQAGEKIKVTATDSEAKEIANKRAQIIREQSNRANKRISLEEIGRRLALGNFKELKLIVKGDVDGSVEALSDSLIKLSIEKVAVSVIHKAVGQIVDSDVMLASASDAIIIGFQVRPSITARKLAEKEGVEIKLYSIIYEAIEVVKAAIQGMLEPTKEEEIMSQVEIREVYKISKVGTVAGCFVQEGKISRNHFLRIIRDGIVVYPTNPNQHAELASLKRFKEDAKEVKAGFECGLTIKNFNDIKPGDVLESYVINEVKATV
ncbi:MAG: translation initiation factor IF-2 [Bacteroidetes bacterium]|nr:translation initiation factor IF-2 [Bacteroidota bacterium]